MTPVTQRAAEQALQLTARLHVSQIDSYFAGRIWSRAAAEGQRWALASLVEAKKILSAEN